jgi:hypothetical protein
MQRQFVILRSLASRDDEESREMLISRAPRFFATLRMTDPGKCLYNLGNNLITAPFFGEFAERDLSFVALLIDVIQDRHELMGREKTGEHSYGPSLRVQEDERWVCIYAESLGQFDI